MKTLLLATAALVALAAPASAKDITITLNDDEQRALVQIFDAALKAQGIGVLQNTAVLYGKLVTAVNAPEAPPPAKAAPSADKSAATPAVARPDQ